MNKRSLSILFLIWILALPSFAQKKMVLERVSQIATSQFVYHYIYSFKDKGKEEKALMVLQVGNKAERFSSMENYLVDSLAHTFNNEPQDTKLLSRKSMEIRWQLDLRGDVRWTLYLNYPEGKRSITDRVFMDHFETVEDNTLPEWELHDEQKEVAGLLCSKASTTLYGRDWVVWYSEKEMRPDGPWLLKGLPGVVVLAEDSTGSFTFQLYKMEKRSTPILHRDKEYIKASRNQVLQAMKNYYDNRAQYVSATAAGEQMSDLPKTETIPYTPLRKIEE